ICTATNYLSSIDFYIELIDKLLEETDKFIVFKAHPWEHQKNNLKGALTSTEIRNHINSLSQDKAERVLITENFNLHNLFKQSKTVITLCSQSAIEAAFFGIKPVQLGQAFYGKKGFSYDYNLIEDFINDYKSESFPSYLTIDEFDKLEEFLVKHLEKSLVSIHKSGILALENKLRQPSLIPLVKPVLKKTVTETHHIPSLLTEKALPIEKIKSVINNEESVISDIIATVEASKVVIKRKGNILS
ncbi:capsular biosynthesis protein, partial [Pantoea sp. JGM49]|nr:capsular biosynthesis protein [Pantoea sp. JGM49]